MKVGEIVGRKSYGSDIYFKVVNIYEDGRVELVGIKDRLKIETVMTDLENIKSGIVKEFKRISMTEADKKIEKILEESEIWEEYNVMKGKVLHIDADIEYLAMCKKYYEKLQVPMVGENIKESEQEGKMKQVLEKYMPDILVITGHDSLNNKNERDDVSSYKSSKYFIRAVREARKVNPSKDSMVIIAGACQSYFEGLIEAGANFASSPNRILIHAIDPVLIASKISNTSIEKIIKADEILKYTITGNEGIGGFQTRGMLRVGIKIKELNFKINASTKLL